MTADTGATAGLSSEAVSTASPVLIGRQAELRTLLDLLSHPPALAVVQGEAGVGKTRLVAELLRQPSISNRRVFIGHCRPLGHPFVLEPVIDALRGARHISLRHSLPPVTGVLRPLLPELDHLLPAPPPDADDPLVQRHLLFRAVLDVLGSLGPTVCVLEDLHWGDTYTAEFIRFAEAHLTGGLSLIVTFRKEDIGEDSPLRALGARPQAGIGFGRVSLTPLSRDEVRSLLTAILGTEEISDEFVTFVHARADGVPFAVEEVLRLILERKDLVLHQGRWIRRALSSLSVPTSISDSVAERFARLRPEARRLVEAAAVIASPADLPLLAAVAALDEEHALDAEREALRSALLIEDATGCCGFRHALANQAVYESMPRALRRVLHERTAAALEHVEPRPLAVLAHHYREAGRRDQWIACAEAAADLAIAVHDDATAVDLLLAVATEGSLAPDTLSRVAIKLARSAVRGLRAWPEVVRVVRAVLDEGPLTASLRGELRYLLGVQLVTAGDGVGAQGQWKIAVSELQERPELAITVMTHLAYPWVPAGTGEDHLRWLELASKAAEGLDDPVVRMAMISSRAQTLMALGDPRAWEAVDAIPHIFPAETTSSEAKRMLVWTWLETASAAFVVGHFSRANELLETGARIAEAFEYRSALGAAETTRLALRWATGAWTGLEAEADRLAETHADSPMWFTEAMAIVGFLAAARGELDKAERVFRRCFEETHTSGPAMFALAAGQLARLRLIRSHPAEAWEVVSLGLDALEAKQIWAWSHWVVPAAIDTMIALGRVDDAVLLLRRVARGLRGRDAPWSEASLRFCRGAVEEAHGRQLEAAKWFADAGKRYSALPHPYEAARATERHAVCRLVIGDRGGEDGLRDAVARFVALGATDDERRVRRALRRHNVPQPNPWRGGRTGYGNRLSPREEAVAKLVVRGRTNAEIARELFLSPKTVEHHIGACMRKLKVRSRIELAYRLTSGGSQDDAPRPDGR